MLKRFFSLVLAFVMVFSLLPVQALAEGTPETEGEQPVPETQVVAPVSDPEPETEPAPAQTEPAPAVTEPAPAATEPTATEPAPAETEPAATEPVPQETEYIPQETGHVPGTPALGSETYGEVTFTFGAEGIDPITVLAGQALVLPECTVENPGYSFAGWCLHRSDDTDYTVNDTFGTGASREFEAGESFVITEGLFDDETYDYTFTPVWRPSAGEITIPFYTVAQSMYQTVVVGANFTIPACTVETPGYTFQYWYLQRDDGAVLDTSDNFTKDLAPADYHIFNPGDVVFAGAPIFDFEEHSYFFGGNFHLENGSATNYVTFTFDSAIENSMFGYPRAVGDNFLIPGPDGENPGFEFAGWFLSRDDGAWMTEGGTFTMNESIPARLYVIDERFDVTEEAFSIPNPVFHAVWKDAITMRTLDNTPVTIAYGGTYEFPVSEEVEAAGNTLEWMILRSDGTHLAADNTFGELDWDTVMLYPAGSSVTISSDIFDGTKYTYSINSVVTENGGGGAGGGGDVNPYVSTETDLRNALDSGASHVWVEADITLTQNLTVPQDVYLHITDGAALTVPAGIALNIAGTLYVNNGILEVAPSGILCQLNARAQISVDANGKLHATGADVSGVRYISVQFDNDDQIAGIPVAKLGGAVYVSTYAQMKNALALASRFQNLSLECCDSITITENLDFPQNISLDIVHGYIWDEEADKEITVYGGITIAPGVTVTTYSYFGVVNDCTLTVSEGACLNALGYLAIYSDAKLVNNGTIAASEWDLYEGSILEGTGEIIRYEEPGLTEDGLREALQGEVDDDEYSMEWVNLTDDITLTANLTVPQGFALEINNGATLTVPAGITLTLEGDVYINNGTLKVAPGGKLIMADNGRCWVSVENNGHLDMSGADTSGLILDRVQKYLGANAQISGIPASDVSAIGNVSSFEQMKTMLSEVSQYREAMLNTSGVITISEDLEIPENTFMYCHVSWRDDSTELIIPSGVTLTNYGNIQLDNECILNVHSGGQLTSIGHLYIGSNTTLVNNGTISARSYYIDPTCTREGDGEFTRYKEPGLTEAQLREALTGDETRIILTGDITLTDDLVIPEDYEISIREETTITVPDGITLTVEGEIYTPEGTLKVAPGGKLITADNDWSWISVGWNGHLDMTGADVSGIIPGKISLNLDGNARVSGVPTTLLQVSTDVGTLAQIKDGIAVSSQYHHISLDFVDHITIDEDLKVPGNVTLGIHPYWYWNEETDSEEQTPLSCTIASGVTVDNRGHFYVNEDCTLTVSAGSVLYCPGSIYVDVGGTLVNNGTIYERDYSIHLEEDTAYKGKGKRLEYETPPMTEDELRAEITSNGYAELTGDLTLSSDLTIAQGTTLELQKGAVLTVPKDVTLTVNGFLDIINGTVKVEEGGALRVADGSYFKVYVGEDGYLDVTGTDVSGIPAGKVYFLYPHSKNIQGIPADKLSVAAAVNNYTDLSGILAVADQYHSAYAEIQKSMTISKDIYIPENTFMEIYAFYNNSTGKLTPSKVTLSSGATIENDGVLAVYNDCTLTVNSGCEIYNGTGYLDVVFSATLVNNGAITSPIENIYFDEEAIIKGTGKFNIIEELHEVTSLDDILAAYENGSTVLRIVESAIEIEEDVTLPKDLRLEFIASDLTIHENATLTAEAELALSFEAGSHLYLDGTFKGKEVFLANDSSVEPAAKIIASREAAAGGCYIKLGLPKATKLNIFEIVDGANGGFITGETLNIDMKYQPTFQLGAVTDPFYASDEVTWKTSSAAIATVDTSGLVTFKKPGTVTITATTADGSKLSSTVKFAVTYLDAATKLTAAAEVPELGLQESFDTTMLVYGIDKENALDPANLTFSIPAKQAAIASVDENGVITAGTTAGTATVTATITGDPLGRKISVKVKVIPLQINAVYPQPVEDGVVDIVMEDVNGNVTENLEDAIKIDVYLDESRVAAETYDIQINPYVSNARESFTAATKGSLKWVSSDTKIAAVKENGDGSATVTVKAKVDGACTITATGADYQKAEKRVTIHVCDYAPRLDSTSVTLNSYMTTGVSIPMVESYGNAIEAVTIADERLEVSYEEGLLTINAKKGAFPKNTTVKTTLTALTEKDSYPYVMTVKVVNSLPAITVKQPAKFNLHTGLDTQLAITAKNAVITDVVLDPETTDSFYQAIEFNPETGTLYLAGSDAYLAGDVAMDAKVEVDIYLEGYHDPIRKAVTIGTSSTKPTVTVKQPDKLNLFYNYPETTLQVTVKGMEAERIELGGTESFYIIGDADLEHGILYIGLTSAYMNGEVKLDTSATLKVYPVGRETPITKNFTIGTATIKPKLVLTPASSTINTKLDGDLSTFFTVYDKTISAPIYLEEDIVDVTASFASYEVVDGGIKLTLNGEKGGTATIDVQVSAWKQPVKLTHKVSVQTALPTPVLGASTLKLNRIFTETTAETTVKLNQSNQQIRQIDFEPVTKGAENIELTPNYENGTITASFIDTDPAKAPKNGNYKFNYIVTLDNEAGTKLAKKTITVNVSSTVPTAKLKTSTLKLNKNLGIYASAETTVSLTKGDGYRLTGMALPEGWNNEDIEVVFDAETGALSAYLLNEQAAAKKHTVSLYPVLLNEATGQEVTLTTPVKLTVQVLAAKVSISVSAKGKLDTMNPDSSINYTVSKLTNIVGDVVDVTPAGDDAELFDVELDTTGTKPVAVLTRKDSAEVATNKTYKLQLVFAVAVNTRDGIENCYVVSNVSFKVSQSALKFASVPAMKLYHSSSEPISCTVKLNTPAGAKIENITLSSKSALQFRLAMGVGEIEIDYADDGRSAEVSFNVKNPGYLVNGKSYTVYLDVTPENNATNVKPTQIKLTVKAYK